MTAKGGLLLAGGAEFNEGMAEADMAAFAASGKKQPEICIVPTAAVPEDNHMVAGENGVRWFRSLGAEKVNVLPVVDRASAEDGILAPLLVRCDIVYLLGGNPHFLAETLSGSLCHRLIRKAYNKGAIVAGSSAGAMTLCDFYLNPGDNIIYSGLGFVEGAIVIPHFGKFGDDWIPIIQSQKSGLDILGIDEQTGMLQHQNKNLWHVYGKGQITLLKGDSTAKNICTKILER